MKHIGIVDVTTVGACICANALVAKSAKVLGTDCHPEFTMHAFPFAEYKNAILQSDWDAVAKLILASIDKLKQAGAEFIIMPSNTPHYAFEKVKISSPLPVMNLIDVVVEECVRLQAKRALILGTSLTMRGDLYAKPLMENGIQPVVPNADDCQAIDRLIFDEIIPSTVSVDSVQDVATRIKKYDCDVIILGCTELPEVFDEKNLGKAVIDTTRLLAYKALDFSRGVL